MTKDIYTLPVVMWIVLSTLESVSYPSLPGRFIGFPSDFVNYLILICLVILYFITRNIRKSERRFVFLYIGFSWSLFLMVIYRMGRIIERITYPGYVFKHFHVNMNSLLLLSPYFLAFFLLIFFEGKLQRVYRLFLSLVTHLIKHMLSPTLIELFKEINE